MVRQEINLYSAEFQQGHQPLSATRIVQLAAGVFVFLLIVEAFIGWRLMVEKEQLEISEREHKVTAARVATLKQNRPLSKRPQLEAEIGTLQEKIDRREELRAIIGGQNLGNASGFSGQLRAMARQKIDTVSLAKFRLLQGGGYAEFEGQASSAESVPKYLQRLRNEENFKNVRFGVLNITRVERQRQLKFSVGQSINESLASFE